MSSGAWVDASSYEATVKNAVHVFGVTGVKEESGVFLCDFVSLLRCGREERFVMGFASVTEAGTNAGPVHGLIFVTCAHGAQNLISRFVGSNVEHVEEHLWT